MKYALPEPVQAPWERIVRVAFIAGLHAAVLAGLLAVGLQPQVLQTLATIKLRMVQDEPVRDEPKPQMTPVPLPQLPQPVIAPPPLPVLAALQGAESSFAVAPPPPAPPVAPPMSAPPAADPAPSVAASFDADYLHNPAPAYPYSARRNHEEGRVVLMVLVSAEGLAKSLKVQRSSGVAALDDSALEAVRHWRFVPARRGEASIDDWVLVPINFHLQHS